MLVLPTAGLDVLVIALHTRPPDSQDGGGSQQPTADFAPTSTMALLDGLESTSRVPIDGIRPGSLRGDDTTADAAKRRSKPFACGRFRRHRRGDAAVGSHWFDCKHQCHCREDDAEGDFFQRGD